jgi:rhamnosyl/mannosyltransferase
MRVVMLTTSWPRGDDDPAGRFLVHQVRELERAGCDVQVLAPGRGFDDHGLAYGAGIVANAKRRPWRVPLLLFGMWRALRRAARDADVVHVHWLLVAPIAWAARTPFVLSLHGSGSAGPLADLRLAERHPRSFRWLVTRARVVIGVSEPLVRAAASAGADAVLVPHGVDVPAPREQPDADPPIALFAGRLAPEKGLDVLARAMEQVDEVQLQMAGDGPLRSLFPQALGFVAHEELQRLYAGAAMLVLPSRSEGFGVVALEAMAAGLPVVASRVGGLAWLVEDEVTGLLVEPGDAGALRDAILRLRDDPALRRRLGDAGRRRAIERFGWEHVTERTLEAYRRVAGR